VCCYPDMPGLVAPAAARARRLLALVFPRDAWWLRLGGGLMNAWLALTRNAFRLFLHRPEAIYGVVGSHGLKPLFETFSGPWQIVIFQRRGN